jgi:diaminobutyrate-2-oxoglutarate transaminase
MAQGLKFEQPGRASAITRAVFDRSALMETSGPADEVVKLLPPLTISDTDLTTGLDILADSVATTAAA